MTTSKEYKSQLIKGNYVIFSDDHVIKQDVREAYAYFSTAIMRSSNSAHMSKPAEKMV